MSPHRHSRANKSALATTSQNFRKTSYLGSSRQRNYKAVASNDNITGDSPFKSLLHRPKTASGVQQRRANPSKLSATSNLAGPYDPQRKLPQNQIQIITQALPNNRFNHSNRHHLHTPAKAV
jgi:hypothetical protein